MKKAPSIPAMPDLSHREAGEFDKQSRWYPDAEFITDSMRDVRAPSGRWPYSKLKHFYTKKYSKQLLLQNPKLWQKIQGKDDNVVGIYIAWAMKQRMTA